MKNRKIKILIADDHEIVRHGIRNLLEINPEWEVCGEAANGVEAIESALRCKPDVMVLDFSIPPTDGLEIARKIQKELPKTKILIFTMHESEEIVRNLLAAGVR
ncbi:MAG: response regulator transcription factor, partial [Acidobacteriota bacterium]